LRGRARLGDEGAQAIVLIAGAMPLLFAMLLLLIDGGKLLVERRNLQSAADAAALAAAQDVPLGVSCGAACSLGGAVQLAAQDYSSRNGGSSSLHECSDPIEGVPESELKDTNCYAVPYIDKKGVRHDGQVEVRLRQNVSTFFGGVVSALLPGNALSSFNVSARAVASADAQTGTSTSTTVTTTPDSFSTSTSTITIGGGAALLFARCGLAAAGCASSDTCDALHISGSSNVFKGAVWTNGGINNPGQNFGDPAHGGNANLYYDGALYPGTAFGTGCLKSTASWWADVQSKAPIDLARRSAHAHVLEQQYRHVLPEGGARHGGQRRQLHLPG
jgi:hypothetical protein